MRALALLIITSILSSPSFAADSVVHLQKNDPAPYTGFLLSPERAERVRTISIEHDTLQKINKDLNGINTTLKTQIKNCNNENSLLSNNTKDTSVWVKAGYFLLGVVITGAIVKAVKWVTITILRN